ncbi:neurogenic locus Notch, partial [Paramuricea clavata]
MSLLNTINTIIKCILFSDIDECLNNNCVNGGTCVQGINYYFCRCLPGFTGDYCDNVLPTCRTSPCLHSGTCIDESPPSFRCACTSNYKGTYCEIEKEHCLSNPCYNGVCVPKEGGYECVCRYGFTGFHCDT